MTEQSENHKENKKKGAMAFLKKIMTPFDQLINKLLKIKKWIVEKIRNHKRPSLQKVLIGVLIILFLVILAPWFPWLVPDNSEFLGTNSDDITCWINYPGAVSVMDERVIELTLTNKLETCIPKVKASLVFPEKLPIVITSSDGSSVADFDSLKANETKTKRIKFYLKRSTGKNEITFKLRVKCNNREVIKKNLNFPITVVPFLGYFMPLSLPLLSALMLIVIPVLNEKLKQIFIQKREKLQI